MEKADRRILGMKLVIMEPLGVEKEALYKRAIIVFENIAAYLDGKPQNVM